MNGRILTLLAIAALAQGSAAEAQGRPIQITVRTELTFGTLFPGLATVIPPNDALNAGEFDLRGRKESDVLVEFLLPGALLGPAGASLPLSFGPGSAGYSETRDINAQVSFDPGVPQVFLLPKNGKSAVFLGGTALPGSGQPAGDYANTVTMLVAYLNN